MFVTLQQMQQLEALTDKSGVSYGEMMDRAGKALADTLMQRYPDCRCVMFLAGNGNNGGDCYVAARYLKKAGWKPEVLAPCGRPRTDIANTALDLAKSVGIPIYEEAYDFLFNEPQIVVDGLFGTGFRGELPYGLQQMMTRTEGKIHVACDIPSGGNGDTGTVSEGTQRATLTVTFGAEKLGMRQYPLREYCGEIVTADIGIPSEAFRQLVPAPCADLTLDAVYPYLPARQPDVHKRQNGHLLAVAGSTRMRGACVLSVTAAMRSGVGLTTCAAAEPVLNAVCDKVPEVMCLPLAVDETGFLRFAENKNTLLEALYDKQALLLGCGLGLTEDTAELTEFLLKQSDCPVILDADGLNAASTCIEWIPKGRTILTPHPGEAARLLGVETAEVQADRPAAALELARRTGAVVALKGAGTIVTDGTRMAVCSMGNPGMARAGSGDVLAGIAASLAAQGLPLYEAACTAVTLHAAAGDTAAAAMPERFMLPQDIVFFLQEVL